MNRSNKRKVPIALSQEVIVFAIFIVAFFLFSVVLKGFFSTGNLLSLLQNVAILGILSIGMGLVIIGRGIDLSIVAVMAIGMAWSISLMNSGYSPTIALAGGLTFAVAVGIIQGILIAYVEIPAIFATLAMATAVYGFGRVVLIESDITHLSVEVGALRQIGNGTVFGVPTPVILFALTSFLVYLILNFTKLGYYIRYIGDNPARARISGIPVRPVIVAQYVISSCIGFLTGLIMAMLIGSMNTRIVLSTMVYDIILIVVLGGIGLSGGKGGVRNVIVGTLLIGTILNGMTIMNMPYTLQNVVKGLILLAAITVDSILNPRDEQTAQQGDI